MASSVPAIDDKPGDILSINDLLEVFCCSYGARAKWKNIGLVLRLQPDDVDSIHGLDVGECLKEVLEKWLRKCESLEPTWQSLLKALRSKIVGHEDVAKEIEKHLKSKEEKVDRTHQEEPKDGSITRESNAQGRKPIRGPLHTVVEEEVCKQGSSSTGGALKRKREFQTVSTVLRRPSEEACTHERDYSPDDQPAIRSYMYGPLKVSRVAYAPSHIRVEEVKTGANSLQKQFNHLVEQATSAIRTQMQSIGKAYHEQFVCRLLSIDCSIAPLHHRFFIDHNIEEAESIEHIFRALSSRGWNFINSDLLEHIIVEILDDHANIQQELKAFRAAKQSFCQATTVCEFEAAKRRLLGVLPTIDIPEDFSVVVFQVWKEWAHYTISEALATWQDIADESQVRNLYPIFVESCPSNSLNLVWAVPTGVISTVTKTLTKRHIRKRNAIAAVCIDGELLDDELKTELPSQGMAMASSGHRFGQRRPPLSVTITGILEEYPDGHVFKEIIQNADDAGARTVRFYLDNRQHGTQSLVHPKLARFQGPALLAYNDAEFEEDDWEGIQNLQRSGKKEDPMKVGKFGIGFNSVYHITDVPVIVSGDRLAFLEPREEIWPTESGKWFDISECHVACSDAISPFYGIGGFSASSRTFNGTIFRFPLRNTLTELSKKLYTIEKLHRLLDALRKEAKLLLLFLRSVDTIEAFEIGMQGAQSEVFRVSIVEKEEVHQARYNFRAALQAANQMQGYSINRVIPLETTFHVQVTDKEASPVTQKSQWLLVSRIGSDNQAVLEAAVEQCVFPWVGVALELNGSRVLSCGGRTFCFLPMPEEASCHLPVHVNGTFGVDKDRRGLKWPSTERRDDPTANWNVLLVQHLLPPCYVALLAKAKSMLTPEAFYEAWPDVNTIKNTPWKGVLRPLFETLFSSPSFWSQVSLTPGLWVTLNQGLFIPRESELPEVVQAALSLCNYKLVDIPASVWDALNYCRRTVNEVSPGKVRAAFRDYPTSYDQRSHTDKLELLRYCLSDRAFHDLRGLYLLPLASGTFACFDRCPAYVCSRQCPRSLLPNMDHTLVDLPNHQELHASLQEVARSNYTNLRELTPNVIAQLLPQAMPRVWQGKSVVSLPHQQFPSEWFREFWEWSNRHNWLHIFGNQLVAPFRPNSLKHNPAFQVAKLTTNSTVVFISHYDLYSSDLLSSLEKLRVNCLLQSDFPYVTCYTQYFHRLTADGVMDAISKTGINSQSVRFTEEEARSLRGLLSSQTQWYALNSQRASVLRTLPIFATTDGTLCAVSQISIMSVLRTAVLQPENFDVFSTKNLPRRLTLLSRQEHNQTVLLQQLSVSFPDLFSFVLNTLIPIASLLPRLSNFVQEIFDGFPTITARRPSTQVAQLYTAIGGLHFVKTSSGLSCRPQELFDPSNALLAELYLGEARFPLEPFSQSRYIVHLRQCGMRTSATPQDIIDIIYTIAPSSTTPVRVDTTKLTRVRAIFKYLSLHPQELSTWVQMLSQRYMRQFTLSLALKELMTTKAWLPVCSSRPKGYPSALPWKGADCTSHLTSLQTGSVLAYCSQGDKRTKMLPYVVGSQVYMVNLEVPAAVGKLFTTDASQLGKQIISHLSELIANQSFLSPNEVGAIVNCIYQYLCELWQAGHSSQLQRLPFLDKWIWIQERKKFVSPQVVATRNNRTFRQELQPYLYILPDSLRAYKMFFMAYGVQEEVTKSQIISVLEMLGDASLTSEIDAQQAWHMVMAILNWLTDNGTKQCEVTEEGTLFVPVESDSTFPQLKEANEVVYTDIKFLRKFMSESESEHETSHAIAHQCVHRKLAHCLGLTSLSEHLGITEDAFGDAGPNEPLTVRLKELLRDYKDGLTIIKELLQNADDAEATEVNICYDARTHTSDRSKLFFDGMAECNGPALIVHNNQTFTDSDFENITKLGGATKENKPLKIGKFGVGFCSVYHITDAPSFVSRDMLYIFDPTLQYLKKEIQDPAKPGKKVKTSTSVITHSRQLDPYIGLFGFEKGASYEGTMFRFPFRRQHSELSSTIYSESTVRDLRQSILEAGSKLALFLQHVNCITFQQISQGQDAPTCLLRITKQEEHVEGTSARLVKVRSTFNDSQRSHTKEDHWLVVTTTGSINSSHSTASVACLMEESRVQGKHIPTAVPGEVFCFLPLALRTGLPVHVSSNFAVMNNRTGIWTSDEAAAKANREVEWNKQLMSSVIPDAYYGLLKALRHMHQAGLLEQYPFHTLWPVEFELETHNPWHIAVVTLYSRIQKGKLFCTGNNQWLSLSNSMVLDHTLLCRSTEASIPTCVHKIVRHLQLPVVELPSKFYRHLSLEGSTITEKKFLELFFDNISSLSVIQESRNEALLRMVEVYDIEYENQPERAEVIESYLRKCPCIPCTPDGKMLRKCTEIIHPKAEFSSLYDPKDGRFPFGEFATNHLVLSALEYLEMIYEFLPWDMLVERAETVKTIYDTDKPRSLERVRLILKCVESNRKYKFAKKQRGSQQLADVSFLPVAPKPKGYPLPWYGENTILSSGKQLMRSGPWEDPAENIYLAGTQICTLNDGRYEDGGCGAIPHTTQQLLQIRQQPTTDHVVAHFKVLISTFVSHQGDSKDRPVEWTNRACNEIYQFLESQLPRLSPPPTSEPFSFTQATPHSMAYGTGTVGPAFAGKHRMPAEPQPGGEMKPAIDLKGLETMPCVWMGDRFIRPEIVAVESKVNGPYLYRVPSGLSSRKRLTQALGIKEKFTTGDIIKALSKMKEEFGAGPVTEACQDFLRAVISDLYNVEPGVKLEVMLPDTEYVMHRSMELAFNDAAWLPPEKDIIYVHSGIPRQLAEKLGVRLVRSKRLQQYTSKAETYFGKGYPFGQREELTQRIQNILREYPMNETVLKELLQNADDAKAEKMYVILDKRTHGTQTVLSDEWRHLQGPALLIWNDKTFSEKDLEGIQKLGLGSKRPDSETIGQYGIGFNVVYHLTDCPSFISGGETLCVMDPHCRYVPGADVINPGRRYDLNSQFWRDFPDLCSSYLQRELEGCPTELMGGSLFRFPLRHTYDLVKNSEIIERQYSSDYHILDGDRMHRLLHSWAPRMKQALLFLNHVKELRFYVIEKDAMVTEQHFEVHLDEAAQLEREHLHENVASFTEAKGSEPCLVRYTMKISATISNPEPTPLRHSAAEGHVKVTHQDAKTRHRDNIRTTEEIWLVQQGIGDMENRNQNWTYIKQVKPRHGLAAPQSLQTNRQRTFTGKVFCFLPLQDYSKLPVHVNGHFILNESRQTLWSNLDDQRGKWNQSLFDAISSSYAKFLEHARDYYLKTSPYQDIHQVEDAVERYYNVFPNWASAGTKIGGHVHKKVPDYSGNPVPSRPVAEDQWLKVAKAVYQKLGNNNSPILASIHSSEREGEEPEEAESSATPLGSQESAGDPSPVRMEYSVEWHSLRSAIGARQVYFWSTPPLSRCMPNQLKPLLEQIGMSITCAPLAIRDHFEEVEVKVPTTLPGVVYDYYTKCHQQIVPETPCPIQGTKFQTVVHFKHFTMYVLKKVSDQATYEFPQSPFGLPLLLTADEQLREFDEENKAISSKYSQLFPQSSNRFLHPKLLDLGYLASYFCTPDDVSFDTINEIMSQNLPHSLQVPRVSDAAQCIQRERLVKVWKCLRFDTVFSEHVPDILRDWALIPSGDNRLFRCSPTYQTVLLPIIPPLATDRDYPTLSPIHQILKTLHMPFLAVDIVQPDTAKAYCPQLSNDIAGRGQVLLNLQSLHKEVEIAGALTTQSLRHLIIYFGVINFRTEYRYREAIRSLPFFLSIDSHFVAISEKTAHVWPHNLCASGRSQCHMGSTVVFLNASGDWKELSSSPQDLGIDNISAEEVYVRYIFPNFSYLSPEDRLQHLKHIRDKLISTNLFITENKGLYPRESRSKAIVFVDALKMLPCIETSTGELKAQIFFYNHRRDIFTTFERSVTKIQFLPKAFTKPDTECTRWLKFFISIGMRDLPTDSEFIEFCLVVAEGKHEQPRTASRVLLDFLFSQEAKEWHNDGRFLSRLSEIPFVCAQAVPQLSWIASPCQTQKGIQVGRDEFHMTPLKGAVLVSRSELVWTVKPTISLPFNASYYYSHVLPLLGVVIQPSHNDVVRNVAIIAKSRYADVKLFDNFPDECKHPEHATELIDVLLKCFEFLSNDEELTDRDCLQLSKIPCIPVHAKPSTSTFGTVLVKPHVVVSNDYGRYHPFLHCLPQKLSPLTALLERIGVKRNIELCHMRLVLEMAYESSDLLEVDVNTSKVVTACVSKLYTLLGDQKNSSKQDAAAQLKPLYLPTDGGKLHLSSDLLYRDTPAFKRVTLKLSELGLNLLYLADKEYQFHEEQFCHVLPKAVRPRGLSECCEVALLESCEEVSDSQLAEALNSLPTNDAHMRHDLCELSISLWEFIWRF